MSDFDLDIEDIASIGMDMMSDEEHPRRWSPAQDPATSPIWRTDRSSLVTYDAVKQVSKLMMKPPQRNPVVDPNSMVVLIAGACLDDGKQPDRASYGVYFGPDSKYNASGLLDPDLPQTNSRGDIEALAKALKTVYSICDKDFSLTSIYIATCSELLFDAMTDSIYKWVEGKELAKGVPYAEYFSVLKKLHGLMEEKEYGDEGGIEVKLWCRPNTEDGSACVLAIDAVMGVAV